VAVIAIQQIRRMRGGAQSHLMLASDNNLYVVKFRNNPQHERVLANAPNRVDIHLHQLFQAGQEALRQVGLSLGDLYAVMPSCWPSAPIAWRLG
jgi:hypothetical protein